MKRELNKAFRGAYIKYENPEERKRLVVGLNHLGYKEIRGFSSEAKEGLIYIRSGEKTFGNPTWHDTESRKTFNFSYFIANWRRESKIYYGEVDMPKEIILNRKRKRLIAIFEDNGEHIVFKAEARDSFNLRTGFYILLLKSFIDQHEFDKLVDVTFNDFKSNKYRQLYLYGALSSKLIGLGLSHHQIRKLDNLIEFDGKEIILNINGIDQKIIYKEKPIK